MTKVTRRGRDGVLVGGRMRDYRQRKMEVEEGQERECTALGSERMEC